MTISNQTFFPIQPLNLSLEKLKPNNPSYPFVELRRSPHKTGLVEKLIPEHSQHFSELDDVENLSEVIENIQSLKDYQGKDGTSILHIAIETYDIARFKLILKFLPELIDRKNDQQITPLLQAFSQTPSESDQKTIQYQICKILLKPSLIGLKISSYVLYLIPDENFSAGHIALFTGKGELAELFFERAPYAKDHKDLYDMTPADWAIYQYHQYKTSGRDEMSNEKAQILARKFLDLAKEYAPKRRLLFWDEIEANLKKKQFMLLEKKWAYFT